MQARRKIAVAGATGRVGRHVVDVLKAGGHEVVAMSRSGGVDVVTGDGLAEALAGVECIIDVATGPSPDQEAATQFFTTAARNLHEAGSAPAYGGWSWCPSSGATDSPRAIARQRSPTSRPCCRARSRYVYCARHSSTRTVAEALADLATAPEWAAAPGSSGASILEIAGPREESLVDMAILLAARRGDPVRIEGVSDPADPDRDLYETGTLLPGPDATLAGPTFEEWLDSTS